jgi:hypothetical protein
MVKEFKTVREVLILHDSEEHFLELNAFCQSIYEDFIRSFPELKGWRHEVDNGHLKIWKSPEWEMNSDKKVFLSVFLGDLFRTKGKIYWPSLNLDDHHLGLNGICDILGDDWNAMKHYPAYRYLSYEEHEKPGGLDLLALSLEVTGYCSVIMHHEPEITAMIVKAKGA